METIFDTLGSEVSLGTAIAVLAAAVAGWMAIKKTGSGVASVAGMFNKGSVAAISMFLCGLLGAGYGIGEIGQHWSGDDGTSALANTVAAETGINETGFTNHQLMELVGMEELTVSELQTILKYSQERDRSTRTLQADARAEARYNTVVVLDDTDSGKYGPAKFAVHRVPKGEESSPLTASAPSPAAEPLDDTEPGDSPIIEAPEPEAVVAATDPTTIPSQAAWSLLFAGVGLAIGGVVTFIRSID